MVYSTVFALPVDLLPVWLLAARRGKVFAIGAHESSFSWKEESGLAQGYSCREEGAEVAEEHFDADEVRESIGL